MQNLVHLRQRLNDLIEEDVQIPAYRKFKQGPVRSYKPADLIRMWNQGLDAPEMAEQLSRQEDAEYPVKASTVEDQLVTLRSVIRTVLNKDREGGMERLEKALNVTADQIEYLLVKRPRETHPQENLSKEARRLVQSGEATSQKDLVDKLKAYAEKHELRSSKLSAIEKAANNARREAYLTGDVTAPKIELRSKTLGKHPVVKAAEKASRKKPKPTPKGRQKLDPMIKLRRYFTSRYVPLPFRDVIELHNEAKDFDDFATALQEAADQFFELNQVEMISNRVRMMIARFLQKKNDGELLSRVLELSPEQIHVFMTQPKRESRESVAWERRLGLGRL